MLSRTGTAASHSLIVASSTNASKSFPNLNHSIPRFLGFRQFSRSLSDCSCSGSVGFGWNSRSNRKFNRSRMEGFAVRASAQPLKNADELIDSVETFIFDCDGEFFFHFPHEFLLAKYRICLIVVNGSLLFWLNFLVFCCLNGRNRSLLEERGLWGLGDLVCWVHRL